MLFEPREEASLTEIKTKTNKELLKMKQQLEDLRTEQSKLIEKNNRETTKKSPSKNVMRLTSAQRKELKFFMAMHFPDPLKEKQNKKKQFIENLEEMMTMMKTVPTKDGKTREIYFGEIEKARLALLIRKNDVHQEKLVDLCHDNRIAYAEELAREYEKFEQERARLMYDIFFQNDFDFDAFVTTTQKNNYDAIIENKATKILDEAITQTMLYAATYEEKEEQEEQEKQNGIFGLSSGGSFDYSDYSSIISAIVAFIMIVTSVFIAAYNITGATGEIMQKVVDSIADKIKESDIENTKLSFLNVDTGIKKARLKSVLIPFFGYVIVFNFLLWIIGSKSYEASSYAEALYNQSQLSQNKQTLEFEMMTINASLIKTIKMKELLGRSEDGINVPLLSVNGTDFTEILVSNSSIKENILSVLTELKKIWAADIKQMKADGLISGQVEEQFRLVSVVLNETDTEENRVTAFEILGKYMRILGRSTEVLLGPMIKSLRDYTQNEFKRLTDIIENDNPVFNMIKTYLENQGTRLDELKKIAERNAFTECPLTRYTTHLNPLYLNTNHSSTISFMHGLDYPKAITCKAEITARNFIIKWKSLGITSDFSTLVSMFIGMGLSTTDVLLGVLYMASFLQIQLLPSIISRIVSNMFNGTDYNIPIKFDEYLNQTVENIIDKVTIGEVRDDKKTREIIGGLVFDGKLDIKQASVLIDIVLGKYVTPNDKGSYDDVHIFNSHSLKMNTIQLYLDNFMIPFKYESKIIIYLIMAPLTYAFAWEVLEYMWNMYSDAEIVVKAVVSFGLILNTRDLLSNVFWTLKALSFHALFAFFSIFRNDRNIDIFPTHRNFGKNNEEWSFGYFENKQSIAGSFAKDCLYYFYITTNLITYGSLLFLFYVSFGGIKSNISLDFMPTLEETLANMNDLYNKTADSFKVKL
jgi:hypothetical protein